MVLKSFSWFSQWSFSWFSSRSFCGSLVARHVLRFSKRNRVKRDSVVKYHPPRLAIGDASSIGDGNADRMSALAGRMSALARQSLSRPLSRAWSRRQHGGGWRVAPPELAARLAAAVGQGVAARSELAASLSSSWRAEPVGEAAPLQGGAGAGKAFAFALRSGGDAGGGGGGGEAAADAAEVGMLRAALWHADRAGDVSTAMLFAPQCHPALPLSIAALPLIDAARATLHQHGAVLAI